MGFANSQMAGNAMNGHITEGNAINPVCAHAQWNICQSAAPMESLMETPAGQNAQGSQSLARVNAIQLGEALVAPQEAQAFPTPLRLIALTRAAPLK